MEFHQPQPYYQAPIRKSTITQTDKIHGSRLPVGTQIFEYRTKTVYLYPSGKSFTRMKSPEEMRTY